jgi:hypothetical protein
MRRSDVARARAAMNAAEAELTVLLASTAARREADQARVARLIRRVDLDRYGSRLAERSLLQLLGTRAIDLAPDAVTDTFRLWVATAVRETQLMALAHELTLRRALGALAAASIPALAIKGVTLAERVHGNAGLRPATDVDLLVRRADIGRAAAALQSLGYPPPKDPRWTEGLPELHYTFAGTDGGVRIELHWRAHWCERGLADAVLDAAAPGPGDLLVAEPAHELALLLLVLARDGLHGPHLTADVVTWWDRFGDRLGPGALDDVAAAQPQLRRPLAAAVHCLERLLGAPPSCLLTDAVPDRSTHRAMSLADPLLLDESADVGAKLMLIDVLLCQGHDKYGFARRYVWQPLPFARDAYGLPDAPSAIVAARVALHAGGFLVSKLPRMIRAEVRDRRTR